MMDSKEWEKWLIKKYGLNWRVIAPYLAKTFDEMVEREKEAKQVKKRLKEQFLLTLEARIQEVAQRLPKSLDEIESELLDLITRETSDVATRFKELSRASILLKNYKDAILSLEVKEAKLPSFERKVQELYSSGAIEADFKAVLDSKAKELAKTFKTLQVALKKIKSKRETS